MASSELLSKIKTELQRAPIMVRVVSYTQNQWPAIKILPPAVCQYGSVASELTTVHGLMRNGRLVIPSRLGHDVLRRLHCSHQGVVHCRTRVRDSGGQKSLPTFTTMFKVVQLAIFREQTEEPLC